MSVENYLFCYYNNNLTKKEEIKLLKQNDDTSKEAIVNSYLKLILKLSRPYKNHNNYEDLLHEGVLGLLHAVSFYSFEKKSLFSSYAYSCIKYNIYNYLRRNSYPVHIPVNKLYSSNKLKTFITENTKTGHLPTEEEECEFMEYDNEKISELKKIISIRTQNDDLLALKSENSNFEQLDNEFKLKLIKKELLKLSEINKTIIYLRYDKDMSWRDIGNKVNLSHECVRKRHNRIITLIRKTICIK